MSQATLCDCCETPRLSQDCIRLEVKIPTGADADGDPSYREWEIDVCRDCAEQPLVEVIRQSCEELPEGWAAE